MKVIHVERSSDRHYHPEAFGLQTPDAYAYTSLSNCLDVPGIDDVQDFSETIVSVALFASHDYSLTVFRMQCKSLV